MGITKTDFYKIYRSLLSLIFLLISSTIAVVYIYKVHESWKEPIKLEEICEYMISVDASDSATSTAFKIFSTDPVLAKTLNKLADKNQRFTFYSAPKREDLFYANTNEIPNSIDYFDPNFGTKILTFFVLFLVAGILVLPPIQISSPDKTDNTPKKKTDRKTGAAPTTEKGPQPKPTDASQKTE